MEGNVLFERALLRRVDVESLIAASRNVVAYKLHLPTPSGWEAFAPDNLGGIGLALCVAHQHCSLQSVAREDGAEGVEIAPAVKACSHGQIIREDFSLHQSTMLIRQEIESHDGLSCTRKEGNVVHISAEGIVAVLAG